jgi:hypothetical protein
MITIRKIMAAESKKRVGKAATVSGEGTDSKKLQKMCQTNQKNSPVNANSEERTENIIKG